MTTGNSPAGETPMSRERSAGDHHQIPGEPTDGETPIPRQRIVATAGDHSQVPGLPTDDETSIPRQRIVATAGDHSQVPGLPTDDETPIPRQRTTAAARDRRRLLGVSIDALTLDETVNRCLAAVTSNELLEVGVVNAAKIVTMRRDPDLHTAVTGCDLVVADGQALVWASRVLRAPLPERVAGIDLFQRLLAEAEKHGLSVYFLGAKPEVLAEMIVRIKDRHPDLPVAGSHHGYFDQADAAEIAAGIKGSGADMLFLGMTSPKKETFVATYGVATGAHVVHGVGGSFDVLAGVVRRAPRSWQRAGMEWAYRALQEPRRLGRRYLTTNAKFVYLVARERLLTARSSTST